MRPTRPWTPSESPTRSRRISGGDCRWSRSRSNGPRTSCVRVTRDPYTDYAGARGQQRSRDADMTFALLHHRVARRGGAHPRPPLSPRADWPRTSRRGNRRGRLGYRQAATPAPGRTLLPARAPTMIQSHSLSLSRPGWPGPTAKSDRVSRRRPSPAQAVGVPGGPGESARAPGQISEPAK